MAGRRPHRQSLPRQRRNLAVHQGRRQGTEREFSSWFARAICRPASFRTSIVDGKPLYRHVADRLQQWAEPHRSELGYSLVGAVVGATYPEQLAELREALPGILFLVPGYGTQGGTAHDIAAAFDANGLGALINNSRGITFAYERPAYHARFGADWQAAIAQAVRDMIDDLAANTNAGRLRGDVKIAN